MLFNSFEFAIFFPVITILFFLIPHKLRWALLLLGSCVFYMYFKPEYILIMASIIVIDYLVALKIEQQTSQKQKKLWLVLSLIANLGILIFFKYFNFLAENINLALDNFHTGKRIPLLEILLPIGLSFHTLQAMSYTIEVSRGKFKAEKHFGIYALYVMFYPQLVAGPIERPQNIIPQFYQEKFFNYENARRGLMLIAWGLFKKVVVADRLGAFVNQVHAMPDGFYTGIPLIISYLACPYQVYCDFSGYSDIARGCAKFMGYELMDNFKTPLQAKNVNQYWASWHISLTTWFRDYAYMPIRKYILPNAGMWLSITVVLVLSGIWHGANWHFIFWGISNAAIVITYSYFKRKKYFKKITNHFNDRVSNIITFFFLFFTVIFFRAESVQRGVHIIGDMFKNIPHQIKLILSNKHSERLEFLYVKQTGFNFYLAIFLVFILMTLERRFAYNNVDVWLVKQKKWQRWLFYYCLIAAFVFWGVFKKSEFIYFQF